MEQLYAALISGAIAIIGALSAFLVSYFKTKSINKRLLSLEEFISSDDVEYYVECPNCGKKIILCKVKILYDKQSIK